MASFPQNEKIIMNKSAIKIFYSVNLAIKIFLPPVKNLLNIINTRVNKILKNIIFIS